MFNVHSKMGATDKRVFELTRGCIRLIKPNTGSPRRLGLSVAPILSVAPNLSVAPILW